MNKKIWGLSFISITSSLLFAGNVLAMMNNYPTIAGKTFDDNTTFTGIFIYFFVLFVSIGAVIMVILVLNSGVRMITGGRFPEEKKKFIGSLIGFMVLLSTYLIINTINPEILKVNDPSKICKDGFEFKIEKSEINSKGEEETMTDYICVKTDIPELPKIVGTGESDMTPCTYKAVIGYSEPNYQGAATTLFDDTTPDDAGCNTPSISLAGYKSVRVLPKIPGLYIYDTAGPQTFLQAEVDDISKFGYKKDSISKVEVLNRDYHAPITDPQNENNKIKQDYIYGVAFKSPAYKEKCDVFDATKTYSLEELGSLLQVRSRIKEKTPGESYIYLYPVPNCGKV
ncbi:MAG: pilin, partial [Candidatus Pacebacteria bacterium]|nr:pilin [Candidatus Paceibacterota bacterium]